MAKSLRIACIQTQPSSSIDGALLEALNLATSAVSKGAEFLFFPEYCGGLMSENGKLRPPAMPEEMHPFLLRMQNFSKENKVWIMIGSIAVTAEEGKIFNRGFVLDCSGKIISRYDKIHMFDIQLSSDQVIRESAFVSPGSEASIMKTPFGLIGHSICYDLRFPDLYRKMAQGGAEMVCVPAAFMKKTGEAHWHILNRARAIENGVFIIAPCSVGNISGGGEAYGHSLIINPWGQVIADGGSEPGIVYAKIDLDEVVVARNKIPSLSHDRSFTLALHNNDYRSVA